ncbi:cold shock domain-containing protein E1 [Copidosoma floridanum]|uniref:cold shock domain-containing protein E1 n=1 Tax=Copidosoma floridanum TaxID=29053 RepID=UPI0006C98334|nr:cold shock domain-containing protein E1 [Copidosoma floridanum]XP_014206711.1 cold shock domain-containing protein E1 [Copidosoma floridanum]XP_014206712.1 cold shock domain-containing protein E1 [Copidosoma floridanum]XP_014206714.1 cold shock domain-containing protein E1 [Copidosoma floridanum]XP_014206715.1 cold shock domain-containing protein E1 [Copidosoma floridanum]XP_014206716.1 cold shock domain-containing protein E1 [Copidosoma floridanum]
MSNNPQWKPFQPPIMNSDPAILEYKSMSISSPKGTQQVNNYRNGTNYSGDYMDSPSACGKNSATFNDYSGAQTSPRNGTSRFSSTTYSNLETSGNYSGEPVSTNNSYQDQSANQGTRETGIIEKLLHSYGFIQCCERQARLFFHFSQFSGNIEHLKIGDPVEFEMTYDRRTGKPIASIVSKIAPEVVLSEERVTGNVTTELQANGDSQGRISYENRGECFFLPYTKDDVEGNVTLRNGDKVSFQIATNQRGNLGACHIRLENPVHPVRYRGVVCSMKESFGFIERADVVKEIFFHFSEAKSMKDELGLGDDVEFIIQTRNGKEVACNITKLPPGSIIFEEISDEVIKGQVLKPLERGTSARHQSDPLPGRIRYRAPDHSEVEVPFGDKDQKGDFTLRHGDWVQFRIATDTRDQLKRATEISLLPESFSVSGERREQGVIAALKEGFGFIRCVDRESRLFFHFNEVLDVDREISVGDEVEFTVIKDPSSSFSNTRQSGIRLKHLPPGSVQFETIIESDIMGTVVEDINGNEPGLIGYLKDDQEKTIIFFAKDCKSKNIPKLNDKVQFSVCQVKRNKELVAVDISLLSPSGEKIQNGNKKSSGQVLQGFIAALKDGFGFIETINHDKEIFFHFSYFDGDANSLELGAEVECSVGLGSNNRGTAGGCTAADSVRLLPKGTIPRPNVDGDVLDGTVIRPLRSANPDQPEYAGLIKVNPTSEDEETPEYEFGIMGLSNKRELLQTGDPVQFQVDSDGNACNIVAVRKKRRATVDAVKGPFGFLAYEVDEGKKLFFHMSEVCDNAKLQPGDQVEFVLVTNQRSGKSSACNVVRLNDAVQQQRPERLISRLRTVSLDDSGPKLIVVRQPKGPDGTKGFSQERTQRVPGAIEE